MNTVHDTISDNMTFPNTAVEVWEELNERFSTVDSHKIYQIQKDLHKLEQNDDFIVLYFHKLKHLWDESAALDHLVLCSCNGCKCGVAKLHEAKEQNGKVI